MISRLRDCIGSFKLGAAIAILLGAPFRAWRALAEKRPTLTTLWTDPDFDPANQAFPYARVFEIPRPRWSTRDAAALAIAIPAGLPATIQERAWSSPIRYAP